MDIANPIRGKLRIELAGSAGDICIGEKLMSMGPLNIKVGAGTLKIGKRCFFNHNVSITCNGGITIGDDCNIANNVVIVDHDHIIEREGANGKTYSDSIVIGDRVWIGANAVITKGVSVGTGSVIAAGAVVTRSIPPHEIWGGVPARLIKRIAQE